MYELVSLCTFYMLMLRFLQQSTVASNIRLILLHLTLCANWNESTHLTHLQLFPTCVDWFLAASKPLVLAWNLMFWQLHSGLTYQDTSQWIIFIICEIFLLIWFRNFLSPSTSVYYISTTCSVALFYWLFLHSYGTRVAMKILRGFLVEGRWYWIHDFIATFLVNDRPIYIALCS